MNEVRPGLDEDSHPPTPGASRRCGTWQKVPWNTRNRAPYVCQSQSTNLFMSAPTRGKVQAALFYG
jgi:hypothetical protein